MPEVLLILFKINLVLLLFAAAYYLVLRRLTFYTVNRAFLAIGIIFSTVYPFIDLTDFFNRQEQINPKVAALVPSIDVNELIHKNAIINYWQIAVVLFYLGVAFMAIRLIAQFISLYRVHQRSKPGTVRNLNVRILDGQLSPFSFWQTVYVNPAIHSANELDTILAHEQVHVKEWHTLDIILAEISVVFYWFNPGVWLMKRAIKENIEFITDARIVKRGIDKKAYQYSLLGVGNLQASVALVNNFNLSDLKKRIKMMNTKRSSPKKLIIYALILPVLLITTLAFTVDKKEVKKHLLPLTKAFVKVDIFNKPTAKTKITEQKTKAKRKSTPMIINLSKKDTVKNIRYVYSTITLMDDSLNTLPNLPESVALAKAAHLQAALKGVVKGMKVTKNTFLVDNIDTIQANGPATKREHMNVMIKREGSSSNPNATVVGTLVLRGYPSPSISNDTLKVIRGKINYIMNGKPISETEFNKIDAGDLKSVTTRKIADKLTEIVVIGKKSN